jgi:hypothetical protein
MSHTERLRRSPNAFRPLTGITPTAFDPLLADLTPRYEQAAARRKSRPTRRRRIGGGRKHALDLADRLLMLLISYRTYATHAFLGFLFGMDDCAACRNINPLRPLLAGIFRIPERRIRLDPEEMRELFFDATERPARRPARGRRAYDSGEEKRRTLKDQVVVARRTKPPGPGPKPQRLRIAAGCETHPGSVPDKKPYDRSRAVAPPDARRTGDTASLGTGLETPSRRPRGGELTAGQRERNGRIARRRIVAEHGIGEMKIWRIAAERYRNPERRHTLVMKNVAGLRNLMYA